ncbi:MAG: hypothetical protein K2F83_07135 [Oscillospiraceae bacterium]|nr:hypothetical protein [Oscillospiraceae bacterium]
MKKFLRKALGLMTLATVVPVNITHDETTGKTTYQSLLASLTVGQSKDGVHTDVGLNLGEGILTGAVYQLIAAQKEAAMFADQERTSSPTKEEPVAEETPAAPEEPIIPAAPEGTPARF